MPFCASQVLLIPYHHTIICSQLSAWPLKDFILTRSDWKGETKSVPLTQTWSSGYGWTSPVVHLNNKVHLYSFKNLETWKSQCSMICSLLLLTVPTSNILLFVSRESITCMVWAKLQVVMEEIQRLLRKSCLLFYNVGQQGQRQMVVVQQLNLPTTIVTFCRVTDGRGAIR